MHPLFRGQDSLRLCNEHLEAIVLPGVGGKIVSLRRVATGTEFLLPPPEPERPYPVDTPGAPFDAYDTSGFDECFPTVGACEVAVFGASPLRLPDHGEVWSRPWRIVEHGQDRLTLCITSSLLPCTLERSLRLHGGHLEARYTLTNLGKRPMPYMWSAHPLLACDEGDAVWLPPSVRRAFVEYSRDERLGPTGSWIDPDTLATVLGRLDPVVQPRAEKLFIEQVHEGHVALVRRRRGEVLHVRFDPAEISGLGLWICQGGWPPSPDPRSGVPRPGHFTVAIEPCRGWPDRLDDAMRRKTHATLVTHDTWTVRFEPADLHTLPDWTAPGP